MILEWVWYYRGPLLISSKFPKVCDNLSSCNALWLLYIPFMHTWDMPNMQNIDLQMPLVSLHYNTSGNLGFGFNIIRYMHYYRVGDVSFQNVHSLSLLYTYLLLQYIPSSMIFTVSLSKTLCSFTNTSIIVSLPSVMESEKMESEKHSLSPGIAPLWNIAVRSVIRKSLPSVK